MNTPKARMTVHKGTRSRATITPSVGAAAEGSAGTFACYLVFCNSSPRLGAQRPRRGDSRCLTRAGNCPLGSFIQQRERHVARETTLHELHQVINPRSEYDDVYGDIGEQRC